MDGRPEVAAAARIGHAVVLPPGPVLGPARTEPATLSFGVDHGPFALDIAELNGDGRPDLAVAARFDDRITFLMSAGSVAGWFGPVESPVDRALPLARARFLPNPFHEGTAMDVELDYPAPAVLRIYDAAGRLVATPFSGSLPAGSSALRWDGRDTRGFLVSRGVYYYRLESGTSRARGKIARF
jgi:hypothetical protein